MLFDMDGEASNGSVNESDRRLEVQTRITSGWTTGINGVDGYEEGCTSRGVDRFSSDGYEEGCTVK